MCQVGVAVSSALTFKCSSAQRRRDCRIWVDTDDKTPCEDDCSGVTRGDQTTERAKRRCREGRDERRKRGEIRALRSNNSTWQLHLCQSLYQSSKKGELWKIYGSEILNLNIRLSTFVSILIAVMAIAISSSSSIFFYINLISRYLIT